MKSTEAGREIMLRRVAPGIWIDADGNSHLSIPELLALVELPDTEENRANVLRTIEDVIRKNNPSGQILYRPEPTPPPNN